MSAAVLRGLRIFLIFSLVSLGFPDRILGEVPVPAYPVAAYRVRNVRFRYFNRRAKRRKLAVWCGTVSRLFSSFR